MSDVWVAGGRTRAVAGRCTYGRCTVCPAVGWVRGLPSLRTISVVDVIERVRVVLAPCGWLIDWAFSWYHCIRRADCVLVRSLMR